MNILHDGNLINFDMGAVQSFAGEFMRWKVRTAPV
jgi:hypothetical protein